MSTTRSFEAAFETLASIREFVETTVPDLPERWRTGLCVHEMAAHLIMEGASHLTVSVEVQDVIRVSVQNGGRTVAADAARAVFGDDSLTARIFEKIGLDYGWDPKSAALWIEIPVGPP